LLHKAKFYFTLAKIHLLIAFLYQFYISLYFIHPATQPFKYTSTLDIPTGKGHMWGKFIFESRLDGRPVEVFVPKFELSSVVDYADY
ncbi:unnamed protein product, partial [Oikopleura dioica]